jgi:hypothetical protein
MSMKKLLSKYGVASGLLLNSFNYIIFRMVYDNHAIAITISIIAVTIMILGGYYSQK